MLHVSLCLIGAFLPHFFCGRFTFFFSLIPLLSPHHTVHIMTIQLKWKIGLNISILLKKCLKCLCNEKDKWQMLLSPFLTRAEKSFLNAPWKTTVFDLTRFSIFKSGILPIYSCVCFWLSCFLSTTHKRSF